MNRTRHAMVTTLLALALVAAACGGSSSDDAAATTTPTTPTTTATSQSPTSSATATTTTKATTTSSGTDTTSGGEAVFLEIGAIDNEGFTKDKLVAPTGEITVEFNNKDVGGEPHNWHIIIVADTDEHATLIKDAPDTQEVTFTIGAPGDYRYYCDTHSETMKGVLTATP